MAKNNANIRIGANTQAAEKGIDRVTSKLNRMSKDIGKGDSLKNLQNSWEGLSNTIKSTGLAAVIAAEIGVLKKELEFINETAEAYNTQLKAEVQLATAAKNNPYLNGESVKNLQNFASSVQEYSVYGDEYLMPFMAELASAGRSEQEIMDIISASADIAATGVMDFGSAVSNLNATFNGTTGALGKTVGEIKNLTKEELAAGGAVKLVQESFAGQAKAIADATGAAQQSANTWGDLKEEIGKITKPTADGWYKFWKSVGNWGIETVGKWNNWVSNFEWKLKNAADDWEKIATSENYTKLTIEQMENAVDILTRLQTKRAERGEELTDSEKDALIVYKDMLRQKKAEFEIEQKNRQETEKIQKIQNATLKENLAELKNINTALSNGANESERAAESIAIMQDKIRLLNSQAETVAASMRNMTPGTDEYQNAAAELERIAVRVEDIQTVMDSSIDTVSKINSLTAQQSKLTDEIANKRLKLLETYKQTVNAAKDEINLSRSTGTTISAVTERQKIIEASQKAYQQYLKDGGIANAEIEAQIREQNRLLTEAQKTAEALAAKGRYTSTIAAFEKEIDTRKKLGEQIDDQTYKTEKLNVVQKALIELITGSKGTVTTNNSFFKDKLKEFQSLAAEVEAFPVTFKDLEKQVNQYAYTTEERQKQELEAIKASFEALKNNGTLTVDEFNLVEKAIAGVDEALKQLSDGDALPTFAEQLQLTLDVVNTAVGQLYSTINGFSDLSVQKAQNEATAKTAALEEQYAKGIKSEEEYQKEKEKIEKESAQKQYKAQMWAWSAQLLQVEASTAVGIMNAYASAKDNIALGTLMAALVAAAGSAQLASAIAAKPVPPSYASGGFIGGMSGIAKGGDDAIATVKRGELVLNGVEQRNLMTMLQNGGATGLNVEVKNYMGDSAQVSTNFDMGKLTVMINKVVKSGMESGDYTQALTSAQNLQNGISYT